MKRHHYIGVAVAILVSLIVQRNGHALTAAEICANATSPYSTPMLLSTTNTLKLYVVNPTASAKPENLNSIIDNNGRYVLCWDSSKPITNPLVLEGTAQFPVTVYGLSVKPTDNISDPNSKTGVNLLTVTGPILLQNLTATNLRGPIVMNGAASMKESALSCDTTAGNVYANAILELKGSNERVNKLTITNCKSGISVAGFGNILTNVVITKDEMMADAIDTGVILGGDNIITSALPDKSSIGGTIKVTGGNVIIAKSILAGDPAVQIAKGLTGVKVTLNTFTKVNTIDYVDADDAKAHTLLSAEWMGKKVSSTDANYATRVVGKLLNQTNTSKIVEMNKALLKDAGQGSWLNYNYDHTCTVAPAAEDIPITLKTKETNIIKKGELYFECAFEADGSTALNIPLTAKVRFISNLPEISTMSEDVTVADFGDVTIVAIAESTVTNGGENSLEAPSNPTGDDDPKIPDPTDTGENANGSAQGNGATSDGFALDGGTPSGYTAGASSMGSCTLSTVGADQGQTASALVWLLALLPLPLMIPFRNSKKDDE